MRNVMRGLEKLLALIERGPEWRARLLADPLAAAEDAGLSLSEMEREIVASVPRATWERMIDLFETRMSSLPGANDVGGVAPARPTADDEEQLVTLGISPDLPGVPEPAGIRPDLPGKKK
jgi:hypothetical protein